MKKIIIFLIAILIPVVIFAKWITGDILWKIIKITDWDTITVISTTNEKYTIRILGLDTPEKSTTRFWYIECYGVEASDYAKKLLQGYNSWSMIYAELYSEDKYHRDLADMYIGSYTGELFAEKMIRDWYGWVYRTGTKTGNYKKLLVAEQYAKTNKLGLWNPSTCDGKRRKVSEWSIVTRIVISTWSLNNGSLTCSKVPRYCKDIKNREEAQFYLNSCWATKFDMDHDGIACEDLR